LRVEGDVGHGLVCEHVFVSGETIMHADADAFFVSVAQRDDPSLRGLPVVVGGGVVMAASYEARRFGVRGGMGGARARRLCPQLVVAQSSWEAYSEASRALMAVVERHCPRVERLGIEEAFLDVAGLASPPLEIGERLRRDVREEVGLTVTVGIARTKLLAKMAGRAVKPDGLLLVPTTRERAFLDPLRVEQLWGIGPKIARKLHARGLRTVGELARLDEAALVAILGTGPGRLVHDLAHNRDRRPVQPDRPRRSYGAQRALGRSRGTPVDLEEVLEGLVERVTKRMHSGGAAGRTVLLRLRFDDYSRVARSHTLADATADAAPILLAARALLAAAMPTIEREGLTCIGVAVTNLAGAGGGLQLELGGFDAPGPA
jgi:DNA polymerase-4